MSTIQAADSGFSVIENEIFRNPNISARAKGVYAYFRTCAPGWKIRIANLHHFFTEGRDAIRKAVKELELTGYVTKTRYTTNQGGRFEWKFTVHATAQKTPAMLVADQMTIDGFSVDGNPVNGKPVDIINTKHKYKSSPQKARSAAGEWTEEEEELFDLYCIKWTGQNAVKGRQAIRAALVRDGFRMVKDGTARFMESFVLWKEESKGYASAPEAFFGKSEYKDPDSKNRNIDPALKDELERRRLADQRAAQEQAAADKRRIAAAVEREQRERVKPYLPAVGAFSAEIQAIPDPEQRKARWYSFCAEMQAAAPDDLAETIDEVISAAFWRADHKAREVAA